MAATADYLKTLRPQVPNLANRIGAWAGHTLSLSGGYVFQAAQVPYTRVLGQLLDRAVPSHLPNLEQITRLFYQGIISWSEMADWLLSLGIRVESETEGTMERAKLWENVIKTGRPTFSLDVLYRAWALDNNLESKLNQEFKRHGFRDPAQFTIFKNDTNPFSVDQIRTLRARDIISDADQVRYLRHAGYPDETIQSLLDRQSDPLDIGSALVLLNRGILTSDDVKKYQKWSGMRDEREQNLQIETRWNLPGLSQLIQWSSLQAFDDDRANKLGLDEEKPGSFLPLASQAGAGWAPGDAVPQNWPYPDFSPADFAWRAHWQPTPSAIAVTMLHRLRDSGKGDGSSRVPGVPAYTAEDFQRDMAASGVPPGRRAQYAAISYSLPRFTVYKQALKSGTVQPDEVIERLQDAGYDQPTSKLLVDTWQHQNLQTQVNKLRPVSLSQVKEAYRLGSIDRNTAAVSLYMLYLDDYQQQLNFLSMPYDARVNEANSNGFVQLALNSIDVDIAGELAKEAVHVVKKAFLRLEINADQAIGQLINLGIVATRARQYVQLWSYEHAASGLEATASQLKQWYLEHLIDQPTYTQRLSMLGYSLGDIALMVARANIDLSDRAAKIQAQTVRAQQMQAKQLANAAKQLAAQQKAVRKAMCSSGTRSQLATWAVKGFVTYFEAYTRLQECGMTSEDAVNLLADKQPKKTGLTREQVEEKITGKQSAIPAAK